MIATPTAFAAEFVADRQRELETAARHRSFVRRNRQTGATGRRRWQLRPAPRPVTA